MNLSRIYNCRGRGRIQKVSIILTKDVWEARKLEEQLIKLIPTRNNYNWFCNSEFYLDWKHQTGIFAINDKQNEQNYKGEEPIKV